MYLENIQSPSDVKKLTIEQLRVLSKEARDALLSKLSSHGGHIGPNLGLVETTIALHYVFDSPKDKIVYDVSHQSYVHKMLTGRVQAFLQEEHYDDVSGYTNPEESEHDFFNIGHTSTSISLASGLMKARDLKHEEGNVIALIGDGSMSGGEAYEGLNYVAEHGKNMIIIVNDNDMSIAENHGGLYKNLKELRDSNGNSEHNFFKAMGLDYRYIADGHDLSALISTLQEVKDSDHPIVVHIHTIKGKGYPLAQQEKETWHWGMPFHLEDGSPKYSFDGEDYGDITATYLVEQMKTDERVVAITSGTPTVFGFHKQLRDLAGDQFVDVGIAEEQAVALASGIAANGGKPVYGVYSTFVQRTYDQLSQDLCINNNPALLLVFAGTISGMSDVTHLGLFDIAMMSNIPNLVYLAPTCKEEYMAMMHWGLHQTQYPVAIRVPGNGVISTGKQVESDYSTLNRYEITKQGNRVAIIALGSFYSLGEEICAYMEEQTNLHPTLINPRYISGLDKEVLHALEKDHDLIITLEDGILDGGFGEKIARFYSTNTMKVKNYGFEKEFIDRYDVETIMKQQRLTKEQIVEDSNTLL